MEGDPSIYYLWLREHPEEQGVLLSPKLDTAYLLPMNTSPADEDDLTSSG